ncbi:flagellar hook-associated protein FlgL [Sporosalibacterium faouarense]|uniref:flagellar hook-associated protein FlgL n=1 Tax=Sporosalibacterium faouarense TaxID=516123 RepID=UPI00141D0163|nr:flagellar hook-associated protein FlgL [Sporosalibacterium faouarense]MTI46805.1 flagellar hook-associated protein 3 [Bacillota bacterium]
MRITNNMLISNMMRNLNANYGKMDKIQQQMSTGKKFQLPSDDPIGVSKSLKFHTDIAMIEQHKRNLNDGRSWLEATEDSVAQIGDILQRTRELAVRASNGSNTNEDLIQISAEIKQLKEQIVKVGNSTYAGRYLFSGFKTDSPLLDEDGNYKLTNYKENTTGFTATDTKSLQQSEIIKYNVGIAEDVEINTIGIRLFGKLDSSGDMTMSHYTDATVNGYEIDDVNEESNGSGADKSYLVSLFETIENAMDVDDKETINKSLTWIDDTMDNVLSIRADIGAKVNRLDLSEQRLEAQSVNFTELLSKNEEINIAEVVMKLKNSENVYRASLSIGAKVIQPTLVDFLR